MSERGGNHGKDEKCISLKRKIMKIGGNHTYLYKNNNVRAMGNLKYN